MINFDLLDINKSYVGLEFGTSFVSKKICKYTKCYAPNSVEIPSHIFGLIFRFGSWWIFESHATGINKLNIPCGVRHYELNKFLKLKNKNKIAVYELPLDLKELELHIGEPYGTGDIYSLMKATIFHNNGKQRNRNGLICSEYISMCLIDDLICNYYKLPSYCITPAHFKNYFDAEKIKAVQVG